MLKMLKEIPPQKIDFSEPLPKWSTTEDEKLPKKMDFKQPEPGNEEIKEKYGFSTKTSNSKIDTFLHKNGESVPGDKTQMFLDWCKNEGVIMPKLEYPAVF